MRRRTVIIGILLVLVGLGAVAFYMAAPARSPISTYNLPRIQTGMTRAQVEAILGGPPGDYRTPPLRLPDDQMPAQLPAGDHWQGDHLSLFVVFDATDRVEGVTGFIPGMMRPSWYRALQEWIPLPD